MGPLCRSRRSTILTLLTPSCWCCCALKSCSSPHQLVHWGRRGESLASKIPKLNVYTGGLITVSLMLVNQWRSLHFMTTATDCNWDDDKWRLLYWRLLHWGTNLLFEYELSLDRSSFLFTWRPWYTFFVVCKLSKLFCRNLGKSCFRHSFSNQVMLNSKKFGAPKSNFWHFELLS